MAISRLPAESRTPRCMSDAVEIHGEMAVAVERDHAALAAGALELLVDHGAHRRARAAGAGTAPWRRCRRPPPARMKNSPWPVPDTAHDSCRIGAGADDRRVADAPVELVGDTAGRGGRGEVTRRVERHRAHGPHALRGGGPEGERCGGRTGRGRALLFLELAHALGRSKVALGHQHYALLERELLGALAGEQHVRGLVHDEPGQIDRVLHVVQPGHRSGAQGRTVHDGGIQLGDSPSWLSTAPRPALNCGSSSRVRTAAATASRLEPPRSSTA